MSMPDHCPTLVVCTWTCCDCLTKGTYDPDAPDTWSSDHDCPGFHYICPCCGADCEHRMCSECGFMLASGGEICGRCLADVSGDRAFYCHSMGQGVSRYCERCYDLGSGLGVASLIRGPAPRRRRFLRTLRGSLTSKVRHV